MIVVVVGVVLLQVMMSGGHANRRYHWLLPDVGPCDGSGAEGSPRGIVSLLKVESVIVVLVSTKGRPRGWTNALLKTDSHMLIKDCLLIFLCWIYLFRLLNSLVRRDQYLDTVLSLSFLLCFFFSFEYIPIQPPLFPAIWLLMHCCPVCVVFFISDQHLQPLLLLLVFIIVDILVAHASTWPGAWLLLESHVLLELPLDRAWATV